jgi:hypothetical protein
MTAVNALPLFEAEAKKRRVESGGDRKSDNYKSVTQKIDEPIISTNTKEKNKSRNDNRATQQVAKQFSTNRQYVDDAKKLKGYPKSYVKVGYKKP